MCGLGNLDAVVESAVQLLQAVFAVRAVMCSDTETYVDWIRAFWHVYQHRTVSLDSLRIVNGTNGSGAVAIGGLKRFHE